MDNLKHIGTQTIETNRLVLKRFSYSDMESAVENWAGDFNVQSAYREPVYSTIEDIRGLIGKYLLGYENNTFYRWSISLKGLNESLGQIAFFLVDDENKYCEIEYCIGSDFQGNGFMTEAVKAVIEYGFKEIGFNRIQISHRDNNISSKRVIEKCGFNYEGTHREVFYEEGIFHHRVYYSILKSEYK